MFDQENDLDLGAPKATSKNPEAQLIAELEKQSLSEIKKLRAHERRETKVRVDLWPGNSSARDELHITGKTNDLSEGGCSAVFDAAVLPGDVYRLLFDPKAINLPLVFARAVRCRMLREDAFEVGFRFFTSITLEKPRPDHDDLLG
jgi:hypothetical protein